MPTPVIFETLESRQLFSAAPFLGGHDAVANVFVAALQVSQKHAKTSTIADPLRPSESLPSRLTTANRPR